MGSMLDKLKANKAKAAELAATKAAETPAKPSGFTFNSKPKAQAKPSAVPLASQEATQPKTTERAPVGSTQVDVAVADSPEVANALQPEPLQGESPATAPALELPEGMEEQQQGFIQTLESLTECFEDVDLVPQITRTILNDLQTYPEFIQMVSDSNRNQMLLGMYKSMNVARASKAKAVAKKPKKATTAASAKKESAGALMDEMGFEDMFGDM